MIADYEILLFYGHSFPEVKTQQVLWGFLSVYPELVAVIGSTVPDYRGIFLRGHGSQTSYHYGAVGHWSAGLGELQGDAIRNITGTHSSEVLMVGATNTYGATGAFYSAGGSGGRHIKSSSFDSGDEIRGFDASRVTPVAQEIRPVNRAVRYLIRAR